MRKPALICLRVICAIAVVGAIAVYLLNGPSDDQVVLPDGVCVSSFPYLEYQARVYQVAMDRSALEPLMGARLARLNYLRVESSSSSAMFMKDAKRGFILMQGRFSGFDSFGIAKGDRAKGWTVVEYFELEDKGWYASLLKWLSKTMPVIR